MKQTNDESKQTDKIKSTDKTKLIQSRATPLLKIFVVMGVVLFCATVLASSCEKNTEPPSKPFIRPPGSPFPYHNKINFVFDNVDTNIVKIVVDRYNFATIFLNGEHFPTTPLSVNINAHFGDLMSNAPYDAVKKVFDLKIEGATGGLVLFLSNGKGGVGSVHLEYIPPIPALRTFSNNALDNEGTYMIDGGNAATRHIPSGLNFFSVFAKKTLPSTNEYSVVGTVYTRAFSPSTGSYATQPLFWCVTTIPGIITISDTSSSARKSIGQKTLAGGQKASCYVGSVGEGFGGDNSDRWYAHHRGHFSPYGNATYAKNSFAFTMLGIKTDGKKLDEIGWQKGDEGALALSNGIDRLDFERLLQTNEGGFNTSVLKIPEHWHLE